MARRRDFVVFGLGKFGRSVAQSLSMNGCDVLAIDKNEEIIQDIAATVTHAVQADVTDMDALVALGVRNFDAAIIAISNDMQSSIMATILVKELGVPFILAKASNDIHKKVLEKVGADKVVFPEREIGVRIANNLISENFVDYIELSEDYSIVEVSILKEWIGKSLRDIDMRVKYSINVMAIKGQDDSINITLGNVTLKEGDVLVVIGSNKDLKKINIIKD